MDPSTIKMLAEHGSLLVIAGAFFYIVLTAFRSLNPKLGDIHTHVREKNISIERMQEITEASTKALESVARSNDNVAMALEALNATMDSQQTLMRILHEDTRETQLRLYSHDDRSEKILTILLRVEDELLKKSDAP